MGSKQQLPKIQISDVKSKRRPFASISSLLTGVNVKSTSNISVQYELPDLSNHRNAPELAHLFVRKKNSSDELDSQQERVVVTGKPSISCCQKLRRCLRNCCITIRRTGRRVNGDELDDLDPVAGRTKHSIEFIRNLFEDKDKPKSGSKLSDNRNPSNLSVASKPEISRLLVKRAYRAAFDGLTFLEQVTTMFKQIILLLTFSRTAEEPLNDLELDLTHGKTVMGSLMWGTTFALQQLQYDADVEVNGYSQGDIKEVVKNYEQLVIQSVNMWEGLLGIVETVETVNERTQNVFTGVVSGFPYAAGVKNVKTRRIKVYKKFLRRAEELENMKRYDPYKSNQTWARFSFAPLRILHQDLKVNNRKEWSGFDVYTTHDKLTIIKQFQHENLTICHTVIRQFEKIDQMIRSSRTSSKSVSGYQINVETAPKRDLSTVRCFEDGLDLMNRFLDQKPSNSWTNEEMLNFLEVDKITLDMVDLLTLETATLRTLIHEQRRIFHICFETQRRLDYMECKALPPYEDVVGRAKRYDFLDPAAGVRKKRRSAYDVEEQSFDVKEAENHFEKSIYQDILKELPVYCQNHSVGLTLQDADAVFTDSTHNLLSLQELPP